MTANRSRSWRTCIGCRKRERPSVLLRVVAGAQNSGGVQVGAVEIVAVLPDPGRRLPGRGAWIHPISGCMHLAEQRRAFSRALRVPAGVSVDTTAIRSFSDQGQKQITDVDEPSSAPKPREQADPS